MKGFVSHIKGAGLDSWWWEAIEGSSTGGGRDTLARSLKRQMLGYIGGVNVTRETKAEWVWLGGHSQWSPLGQNMALWDDAWRPKLCFDQSPGERSAFFPSPVWMWEIKYIYMYMPMHMFLQDQALVRREEWHSVFSSRRIVVMRKILIPHERILINCPYTWGAQCLAAVPSCTPSTPCFQRTASCPGASIKEGLQQLSVLGVLPSTSGAHPREQCAPTYYLLGLAQQPARRWEGRDFDPHFTDGEPGTLEK